MSGHNVKWVRVTKVRFKHWVTYVVHQVKKGLLGTRSGSNMG